ncbi:MAG: RHS repeat-associated core domain-containing protein [Chthonomonadetes bacterium]|nr:RHS repeat-associated core domain-containing protein [Chthonomonadetes bacterium]
MENLYDGEELVCELDASGNVVAGIVHGANGLLVYGSVGYQFDPQGNSTHLLNDNGYAVSHLAYDAWGELKWGSNPTPYGYKGQWGYYRDMETGLLLLTYRYFDPATGRFLTRDPIGVEGGVNLYAYVRNGVVKSADPSGFATWCEVDPGKFGTYYHAFIRFDLIECNGSKSYGFWPAISCPIFPWLGNWESPDRHEEQCTPVLRNNDIRFEKALCECITESVNRWRIYQFPCYACGTWVKDMWNCAKERTYSRPPVPRPDPIFPPGTVLPGQCIRLPNGREICG